MKRRRFVIDVDSILPWLNVVGLVAVLVLGVIYLRTRGLL